MKSEKARQELEDGSWKVEVGYEGEDVDLPYHAVRVDVAQYAVELAEQEAEERMQTKAHKIILDMMTGIFHGNMPQKIADEFIQKLTDDENN